ncbi:Rev3, catalytic subunit of DNA polymerase zeta [Cryphonectria parasitica EP155]|uniref:DNA polymerase n=1 Tax=Cryphonectria parasitica (strain ATCC 38755 / EP155) TaxID=660469 RepID=A0A9P5CHD0_CRYP1|nr:Rev3, catalytic subunit of DNA polymerase zeta [Cryphonectria parasitica EP155]KAF3760084.1 Rev3, catalytic subunit of DNA polymerase zeta [Cryphonectria parasitica EP155]
MDVFKVRLNCIDFYQATPTKYDPQLRNDVRPEQLSQEPKVPVVRIFGSTQTGQKVCAHIHGAFPYLYIEYTGGLGQEEVGAYIYRLHLSIDHALAVSFRQNAYNNKNKYVARITITKGVPFYGYHVGYRFFLKIYMFNPMVMTRLADLLQQGAIMKRRFQPYEAHLQYLLQFMCDYNLYGCDYLESGKTVFRSPVPDFGEEEGSSSSIHVWHSSSIPHDRITEDHALPRVSHCSIEVDICVQDILNRKAVKERRLHHDFTEKDHPVPSSLKLVHSMAGLWKDETKRRKRRMGLTKPGSTPFPPEALVSMSADPRDSQPQGWIHEDEYMQQIQDLIAHEAAANGHSTVSFDTFVQQKRLGDDVNTMLQSVEDLFPHKLMPALGLPHQVPEEQIVAAQEEEDELYPEDSDEERIQKEKLARKASQQPTANYSTAFVGRSAARAAPSPPPGKAKFRPARRYKGIGLSKGKTGQYPVLPITEELIEAISREGLAVKDTVSPPSPNPGDALLKRASSPNSREDERKLSFGVVKDPQDPSTILRLSQHSSSQKSDDELIKRDVSFGKSPTSEQVPPSTYRAVKSPDTASLYRSGTPPSSVFNEPQAFFSDDRSMLLAGVLDHAPPTAAEVCATMQGNGLPDVIYQDPFYSREKDVPPRMKEYAGKEFRLTGNTLPFLPEFDATGQSSATFGRRVAPDADKKRQNDLEYERRSQQCSLRSWEIADPPPTLGEVREWWAAKQKSKPFLSQIVGATPKNKHGFKYSQRKKTTSVEHEAQYMSTMSLEVHVSTRGKLAPNPEEDEVQCIFWATKSDENFQAGSQAESTLCGIIVVSEDGILAERLRRHTKVEVLEELTELDAMVRMVETVRNHDPDVLTGYEVHGSSWGYLIERARHKYDYNLCDEFSRVKTQSHGRFGKDSDRWGFNTTSTIRVTGRHMINIWRAMRGEMNLLQYTMENVTWHLLHRRIPHYNHRTLSDWYASGRHADLAKVLQYYISRTKLDIQILEENELIPRTSEQARLLGVDFFSVFSRGSQFKVESIMFRIAKPENFVLVSPSRKQVGGQNALECLPLVMEPQSAFYSSPVLVLDFQSLYPSVMIAYNLCYSTFLGRIVNWRGTNKMGFTEYKRQERLLELLQDYINITPNGMMYAKVEVRKSLLAKMLTEILETRVMVKSGMKQDKADKTLQQLLNNRQLALKLLANVTYGYTSASFSGRMPCSEIADSIVQTGRETLERAIAYIHSVEKWGAEVVYGDTDSLFIHLKGRTRDQAFDIGNEIAKAITDMNPRPVKLKFEKVYHPCVLLAKKRYVGYKYESRDQVKPEFDAKGIETVRRDGTPAEQMIEEKALKLLFETADLSQIKSYVQAQCAKIMRGQVSVQDFCFAKEVKLGTYSDKGPPPPGALIATRKMLADARAEPQYGERVPYVVVSGAPGARLIDRCIAPEDLLDNDHLTLDAEYYITKNLIPPLERIFNLVGASARQWYDEMPKVRQVRRIQPGGPEKKKVTLESYLRPASCVVCNNNDQETSIICRRCRHNAPASLVRLQGRLNNKERRYADVVRMCQSCAGLSPLDEVHCDSKDCPVFYSRMKEGARMRGEKAVLEPVIQKLARLGIGPGDLDW